MPATRDPAGFRHGTAAQTGVLLVNLGTPDAPTAPALRRYLREFLSDPRVVELPRPLWWPILNGIILPLRSRRSAARYAAVWTPGGSPLLVGTAGLARAVGDELAARGHRLLVRHAMRYGSPGVGAALDAFAADNVTRVLLVPLYPQYCAATTASTIDAVGAWMRRARRLPELRVLHHFHDAAAYIDALARKVQAHWARHGRPDLLVMSFHGMPARTLRAGDPYFCECQKTARLLAERLALPPSGYRVTFQSRFGRQRWLEPYTASTLRELAREGIGRVDVICPGFSVDCLETLEEIAVEAKQAFLSSGGREFHYIDCLNAEPQWAQAFAGLVETQLQGWDTRSAPDPAELLRSRAAAQALGADNLA